jgi:hypothetical protein
VVAVSLVEEGVLPGGGVALLRALKALDGIKPTDPARRQVSILGPISMFRKHERLPRARNFERKPLARSRHDPASRAPFSEAAPGRNRNTFPLFGGICSASTASLIRVRAMSIRMDCTLAFGACDAIF